MLIKIGEGPARGAKTDRRELRWLLSELAAGEMVMVTRLARMPTRAEVTWIAVVLTLASLAAIVAVALLLLGR